MSTPVLLITEITPRFNRAKRVSSAWSAMPQPTGVKDRKVYRSLDDSTVMELIALDSLACIESLKDWFAQAWCLLGADITSDFRRQLLSAVEAPIDISTPLPENEYVQLRHVEVLPLNFDAYRRWRCSTIFDVVRTSPQIRAFLAFHSVVSTDPGVMFLSGFNGPIDTYQAVFDAPRYRQIVQDAGDRYITGGSGGLYTRIYRMVAGI